MIPIPAAVHQRDIDTHGRPRDSSPAEVNSSNFTRPRDPRPAGVQHHRMTPDPMWSNSVDQTPGAVFTLARCWPSTVAPLALLYVPQRTH